MADTESSNGALVKRDGALAGAAVSAAVGAALYGLRRALAERGEAQSPLEHHGLVERERGDGRALLAAAWDSASDSLLPLAEDAAEAAGRWVAENAPAVIRERLLPRFIESFRAAA